MAATDELEASEGKETDQLSQTADQKVDPAKALQMKNMLGAAFMANINHKKDALLLQNQQTDLSLAASQAHTVVQE